MSAGLCAQQLSITHIDGRFRPSKSVVDAIIRTNYNHTKIIASRLHSCYYTWRWCGKEINHIKITFSDTAISNEKKKFEPTVNINRIVTKERP